MTLREWRKEAGKSQDDVSDSLRLSQAYYSKLELGRRCPSMLVAARIVRVTKGKVSLSETGVRQ